MTSATVPADNPSPLESAEEILAQKALAQGANVVMGINAFSATPSVDGTVDFGSTDKYNLPSYGKIILPGSKIVVWGLATLYNHSE